MRYAKSCTKPPNAILTPVFAMSLPLLVFSKAFVKEYHYTSKSGKLVHVESHYDKRTKKGTEHAPAHGWNLSHLDKDTADKFDRMHAEQHLMHHYNGHARRERIKHHEKHIETLKERIADAEAKGMHKTAAALKNKLWKHGSDLQRHQKAVGKIDATVKGIGKLKDSMVLGSGEVEPSTDESHAKYADKMGAVWKPKVEKPKAAAMDSQKAHDKMTMLQDMVKYNPNSPNADTWKGEIEKLKPLAGGGVQKTEPLQQKPQEPDTSNWSDAKKMAYDLHKEYKDSMGFAGSPKKLGAFKNKMRSVAKKIPENDEQAVLMFDMLATKVFGDYDPKEKSIQFAPPKTSMNADDSPKDGDTKQGTDGLFWSASVPRPADSGNRPPFATASSENTGKNRPTVTPGQSNPNKSIALETGIKKLDGEQPDIDFRLIKRKQHEKSTFVVPPVGKGWDANGEQRWALIKWLKGLGYDAQFSKDKNGDPKPNEIRLYDTENLYVDGIKSLSQIKSDKAALKKYTKEIEKEQSKEKQKQYKIDKYKQSQYSGFIDEHFPSLNTFAKIAVNHFLMTGEGDHKTLPSHAISSKEQNKLESKGYNITNVEDFLSAVKSEYNKTLNQDSKKLTKSHATPLLIFRQPIRKHAA